jgi:hypothetical protein
VPYEYQNLGRSKCRRTAQGRGTKQADPTREKHGKTTADCANKWAPIEINVNLSGKEHLIVCGCRKDAGRAAQRQQNNQTTATEKPLLKTPPGEI